MSDDKAIVPAPAAEGLDPGELLPAVPDSELDQQLALIGAETDLVKMQLWKDVLGITAEVIGTAGHVARNESDIRRMGETQKMLDKKIEQQQSATRGEIDKIEKQTEQADRRFEQVSEFIDTKIPGLLDSLGRNGIDPDQRAVIVGKVVDLMRGQR